MPSVTERLKQTPKNKSGQRKHSKLIVNPTGKWQNLTTLAKYRRKRNKARKVAKASRRHNRLHA